MPAIETQPSTQWHSAYNEIYYRFSTTQPILQPLSAIDIDFKDLTDKIASAVPYSPSSTTQLTLTRKDFFDLDVGGVLQESFDNSLFIPDSAPGLGTLAVNNDLIIRLILDVYEWVGNSDNLLAKNVVPVSTNDIAVFNGWVDQQIGQSASDYVPTSASKKFLSNAPIRQQVGLNQSAYLYYLTQGNEELRIECVSTNGSVMWVTQTSNSGVNSCGQVGIGPANLLNNTTIQGSVVQDDGLGWRLDDSVAYYDVWLQTSGGSQLTMKRRYYIDKLEDCVKYRIHFLNQVGGFDSISVYNVIDESFEVTSKVFQQSLPYLATEGNVYDGEVNRLFAVGEPSFTIQIENVRKNTMIWLRELMKSTLILLEKDGRWIPVYGKRPKQRIRTSAENVFEMDFYFSNRDFAQIG